MGLKEKIGVRAANAVKPRLLLHVGIGATKMEALILVGAGGGMGGTSCGEPPLPWKRAGGRDGVSRLLIMAPGLVRFPQLEPRPNFFDEERRSLGRPDVRRGGRGVPGITWTLTALLLS